MNEHLHITIWGLGNVGTSLLNFLATKTTHRLSVITSSDFTSENIPSYATLAELGSTDIIIVCVPDDRVIESVREAKNHATYTAHTSGSISLIDTQTNSGVFYPFQTFTKGQEVDWAEVPICIESKSAELRAILFRIGNSISNTVKELSSGQRAQLHLVGVLAANFNNHLHHLIQKQLEQAEIDPNIVEPLLKQTQTKLQTIGALNAQTGPARRGDVSTIEKHLKMLKSNAELKELYVAFTRSIEATYK